MIWDWAFAFEILPLLAQAAVVTIEATVLGFLIAAILGLVLASLRIAVPATAWPISVLVELIRSTPLLIQIFFVYFVFPKWGLVIDAFAAGVLAIGIHYAAYCSEVYRAGTTGGIACGTMMSRNVVQGERLSAVEASHWPRAMLSKPAR